MTARDRLFAALALTVLALDLVTKAWAERVLTLHQPVAVVDPWLRWTLTYNRGAAMNLSVGELSRLFFGVVAVVILVVIWRVRRGLPPRAGWTAAALGLVAGGAVGNLVDRVRHDMGVVDFIDVGTQTWRFWTFNVADSGVSVGAVILLLATWRTPAEASTGGAAESS